MRGLLLVLLLFLVHASPLDALLDYYDYAKAEDLEGYLSTMEIPEGEYENTAALAQAVFNNYDVANYNISDIRMLEDGDYALITYDLGADVRGAETFSYTDRYIALLHRVGGDWKVVFAIPLSDYMEAVDAGRRLTILNDMIESEANKTVEVPEGEVYFDGEPMEGESGEESAEVCAGAVLLFLLITSLYVKGY